MDDVLLGIVLQRLDADPLLDEASNLLLAALDSDDALNAHLSAGASERRVAPAESSQLSAVPVGAYLRSLTVSGFRGIGPSATLEVAPGLA